MNLLVVGSGAREHAIAWKARQSGQEHRLFVAPGNAGTASIAANLPIAATDVDGLVTAAEEHRVDLTIVGPEASLVAGLGDRFQERGLAICGPTRAAASIEASKGFAKELMKRHSVPCADGLLFDSFGEASRFVQGHEPPLVVKADGLAEGKGVTVARDRREALRALEACMVERVFGSAGDRVVIEEALAGRELSVFAFTDGEVLSTPVAACDYKRAYDGDRGPNTGGMGSYSPPEFWDAELEERVREPILERVVSALARCGSPYRGVLYAGLVLTAGGPKVLEFNCRLGDPEAQVVLPRLDGDLVELARATSDGGLERQRMAWTGDPCVGVVLASGGYPGPYRKGVPVTGVEEAAAEGGLVFQAGTALSGEDGPGLVTSGGRVATVVGKGASLAEAAGRAYRAASRVHFQGAMYRRDIAAAAFDAAPSTLETGRGA